MAENSEPAVGVKEGGNPSVRPVPFPSELLPVRQSVQAYVNAKVRQFGMAFAQALDAQLNDTQLEDAINKTIASLGSKEVGSSRALRLVLRHDCMATGCGEPSCLLCQFNPSRLCKRNLKNKYLIDDHIKAKCNAPLRVELVDETGACVLDGLPPGMQLEVHVLNGEKYKEICPDNVLLSHQQLRACIISHHTRALLRREGGSDDQLRCFLQLETGTTSLSDLQVTTSSEALLSGKAPTFRLLVWAVDENGEPVTNVTYVVSENFVVATKRVKHAIKSDIPSITDSVSKLVHIGKATVEKLNNLRQAAMDEGFVIQICDELNRLEKVGQFQQLVELSELNPDLKYKIRHLLKLSPEKWEEVAQHAQGAVVPDFRPRAWWCPSLRAGLLFGTKNGSVCMDQPVALVKMGATPNDEDEVVPVAQLDPTTQAVVPRLKAGAMQSWYSPQHPGWSIYFKEGVGATQDPTISASIMHQQQAAGQAPNLAAAGPSSTQAASNMATSLTSLAVAATATGGTAAGSLAPSLAGPTAAQQHALMSAAGARAGPRGAAGPAVTSQAPEGSGHVGARRRMAERESAVVAPAPVPLTMGRQSGRKRKPTQLPGADSPPRAAPRGPSPPVATLPPPSAAPPLPLLQPVPVPAQQQGSPLPADGAAATAAAGAPTSAQGPVQAPMQASRAANTGGAAEAGGGVQGSSSAQAAPDASPFATPYIMGNLADHFPCWQRQQLQQLQQQQGQGQQGANKSQQQDSLTLLLPRGVGSSGLGGIPLLHSGANVAGQHLLPFHTGLPAGAAAVEQAGQLPGGLPAGALESGALLLTSGPLMANPLMSHLPFGDAMGGSFNMPSFTLTGMNGAHAMGGLHGLQGSGSLHLNGHGPQPPSLNGSMQLGSPALGHMSGGGLQANGGIGSGSLPLNAPLLPQESSIENGSLPLSIPKLVRTEPQSAGN